MVHAVVVVEAQVGIELAFQAGVAVSVSHAAFPRKGPSDSFTCNVYYK